MGVLIQFHRDIRCNFTLTFKNKKKNGKYI